MQRVLAAVLVVFGLFTACGGDDPAPSPAPTATSSVTGRIMGPAGTARDTVDQLNDIQEREQNAPGGG